MILCITDVNEVLVFTENVAEALWVVKLCFIVITVNQADLTVSDLLIKLHCLFVHQHNSIVSCVRNHNQVVIQACLLLDANHLARVSEVLSASTSFFTSLTHGLVFELGSFQVSFLLFRLPLNRCGVV